MRAEGLFRHPGIPQTVGKIGAHIKGQAAGKGPVGPVAQVRGNESFPRNAKFDDGRGEVPGDVLAAREKRDRPSGRAHRS